MWYEKYTNKSLEEAPTTKVKVNKESFDFWNSLDLKDSDYELYGKYPDINGLIFAAEYEMMDKVKPFFYKDMILFVLPNGNIALTFKAYQVGSSYELYDMTMKTYNRLGF